MMRDIADLTTARPHIHTSARFTAETFRLYSQGYYTGIITALKVAEFCVERYKAETARRRKATKEKRRA